MFATLPRCSPIVQSVHQPSATESRASVTVEQLLSWVYILLSVSRSLQYVMFKIIILILMISVTISLRSIKFHPIFTARHSDTVVASLGEDVKLHCQVNIRKYLGRNIKKIFLAYFT